MVQSAWQHSTRCSLYSHQWWETCALYIATPFPITLLCWWNMFFVSFSILPGGFCIESLQPAHAELIADCYQNYEPGYRLDHFKSCLSKASVGVFTETIPPNLVCWILRDYDGSLRHLYTVEQYRRRGLASAVVRMMCRRIQDQLGWCAILLRVQWQPHLYDTVPLTGVHWIARAVFLTKNW